MPNGIMRSVGANASNQRADVKLIQIYLNANIREPSKKLAEDGLIGKNTISAIKTFQQQSVGMGSPDGRVDPNGKTFRYLTMYIDAKEQNAAEASVRLQPKRQPVASVTTQTIRSKAGLSQLVVTYKDIPKERQLVSEYSKNVIRLALKEAGMEHAVITSTLRFPSHQASIMLKNAKISLQRQMDLYGSAGDEVLEVYRKNKTKSDNEIIELMTDKILELAKQNRRVSLHCVPKADYEKLNVIDIGFNSTRAVNKNFSLQKFTNACKALQKEGYITKFIDETGKSNSCWHLEIKPNGKAIAEYNKSTILLPTRFINGVRGLC